MTIALVITALVLFLTRKAIARAVKRYIKRKKQQLKKWAKRQARMTWTATKVGIARRTIGLQGGHHGVC